MIFRLAHDSEEEKILLMYRSAVGQEFCAWDEEYPGREEIRRDLSGHNLFVLESDEGALLGAISIEEENELKDLDVWADRNAAEFARVVIDLPYRGRGLSKVLVDNILRELRARGYTAAHIAVAEKNVPAMRCYHASGFSDRGGQDMYGSHFVLCEKILIS